jgi:hypothetical protein
MTTTHGHRRRNIAAAAALALAITGIAACGDDGSGTDDTAPSDSTPTTLANVDPGTVEVTATNYHFDDLPAEVSTGTALGLQNASAEELHELVAMRLADDEDRTAAELVALSEPELGALFAGPPALVVVAPPGEDGFAALGDGTLGVPGRYLIMCFIPTGADPAAYLDALEANPGQPPSVPGGPPHFTAGMYGEVFVR